MSYSNIELINQKNPGTGFSNVHVVPETKEIIIGKRAEELTSQELGKHSHVIILSPHYFNNFLDSEANPIPLNIPYGLSGIEGESTRENASPMRFILNTNSDAPAGNYKIDFVLTFSDGDKVQSDHEAVEVHVKSDIEIHGWWLSILAIVIAITSIIAGSLYVPRFVSYIKSHTKTKKTLQE